MTTHSAVLALYRFSVLGQFTLATVPIGQTWIVKQITAYNETGSAIKTEVWASDPPTGVIGMLLSETVAAASPGRWDGWLVLTPGQVLKGQVYLAGNIDVWVSGTKLTGVAL